MTPETGNILLNDIMPILIGTIPRTVRPFGCEDPAELVQDAILDSAKALQSLEDRGIPILPNSVAYYSIQRLKSGRRSYSAGTLDVMSPGCIMFHGIAIDSFDHNPEFADNADDRMSLAETLYDRHDDPATLAGRELDWDEFLEQLPDREADILRSLADGYSPSVLAERH